MLVLIRLNLAHKKGTMIEAIIVPERSTLSCHLIMPYLYRIVIILNPLLL